MSGLFISDDLTFQGAEDGDGDFVKWTEECASGDGIAGIYSQLPATLSLGGWPDGMSMSYLYIVPNFRLEVPGIRPHRWHRLWQRLLLGWRWERVEG